MATKIFVNLPVKDLKRSMDFFTQLGYSFNQQFTDDTAASLVITDDIYAMLLTHDKFREFISNEIADTSKTTQVLLALSFDSKEQVDAIADKALRAGGSKAREPKDHGFMYEKSFKDPDGHIWEAFWMDPAFIQQPAKETVETVA
jgi:predicted lactoylglutathione lyase